MNRPKDIADRAEVFYWQTDRAIEPEAAGEIWADRHRYFSDQELINAANSLLASDKIGSIEPLDPTAQTNLGNVNSVRSGTLKSGKDVIIRCHPKGVKNGYFHVEAVAAQMALEHGLPTYRTLSIHDYVGNDDFAFEVIEKLPNDALQCWLEQHPEDESKLLFEVGSMMARLHQVTVEGFGPFDNEVAKTGTLQGLHNSYAEAVRAGIDFNLSVLHDTGIFSPAQGAKISRLFEANELLECTQPVLVHNDFADWNLLTDGERITGILDWDECVGGDPVSDIACWSTFFAPERLPKMLDGYWSVASKSEDFDAKFELMRLRYTISKMTLRLRRYSWDPSEPVKQKIENGKLHLAESLRYFGLGEG